MRTAKTDQTGQLPRLIWVFAGRTCHFVWFCHEAAHLASVALWPICVWVGSLRNFIYIASSKEKYEPHHEKICLCRPHSLISVFGIRCLDSLRPIVTISKILRLACCHTCFSKGDLGMQVSVCLFIHPSVRSFVCPSTFTQGVLWAQLLLQFCTNLLEFWNFGGVFMMVWGCACGLDIIVRLFFVTFSTLWT